MSHNCIFVFPSCACGFPVYVTILKTLSCVAELPRVPYHFFLAWGHRVCSVRGVSDTLTHRFHSCHATPTMTMRIAVAVVRRIQSIAGTWCFCCLFRNIKKFFLLAAAAAASAACCVFLQLLPAFCCKKSNNYCCLLP